MRLRRSSIIHNIIHQENEPYTLYIQVKGTLEELKEIQEKLTVHTSRVSN